MLFCDLPRTLLRTSLLTTVVAVMMTRPAGAEVAPAPLDDRFGWTRGDVNAHYVGWTGFQDEAGTGMPFDPNPIVLDTTPNAATAGSSGEVRETGSSGALISGSGNVYSFSGPLRFANVVSAAGLATGYTRVVAQVQTWGTEYDPASVLLSSASYATGVAPTYVEETGRLNLGPPPQGSGTNDQVDTLFYWDLVGSDPSYTISIAALGAHQSLAGFHADVFSQAEPFSVPEPSAALALTIASLIPSLCRRRRR